MQRGVLSLKFLRNFHEGVFSLLESGMKFACMICVQMVCRRCDYVDFVFFGDCLSSRLQDVFQRQQKTAGSNFPANQGLPFAAESLGEWAKPILQGIQRVGHTGHNVSRRRPLLNSRFGSSASLPAFPRFVAFGSS